MIIKRFGVVLLLAFFSGCGNQDHVTIESGFQVTHRLALGRAPHGIRFSETGERAFVCLSGDGQVAEIDLEIMQIIKKHPAGVTPLDLVWLNENQDWLVTQFQRDSLILLQEAETFKRAGRGASLFDPRIVDGVGWVTCEFADTLIGFDTKSNEIVARYATGQRPYPADVTRDGKTAFVPNRTDATVSVIDLESGNTVKTVKIGADPEGGALTQDDAFYLAACGGTDEVMFIDTKSLEVVAKVSERIGPRPFSVLVSKNNRYGLVNNAGGNTVSIIDIALRRVIEVVEVGEQPIVMRAHPDGKRIFISNEKSDDLAILEIPGS